MQKHPDLDINQLLDKVEIPRSPDLLVKLNKELQQDHPDLSRITELIQKDISIAALVIKTVNSPLFPVRNTVTSVHQAINLLGISYTINIIMGLILRQTLDSPGHNLPRYWEEPSNIALIIARLCKELLPYPPDEAYLLGLFHNCGHALIHRRYQDYHDFYQQHLNDVSFCISYFENQHYQFDHAVLSYYLAKSWKLPQHICEIILNHHKAREVLSTGNRMIEDKPVKGLLAILKIANHIDQVHAGFEEDYEWERVRRCVLDYLVLSEHDYEDLSADMLEILDMEAA